MSDHINVRPYFLGDEFCGVCFANVLRIRNYKNLQNKNRMCKPVFRLQISPVLRFCRDIFVIVDFEFRPILDSAAAEIQDKAYIKTDQI